MQRHAFLIVAHNRWEVLEALLGLLDHPGNDIFLHIDKSVTAPVSITEFKPLYSGFTLISPRRVRWADYSLVAVTLDLLKASTVGGGYRYYHLLSGVDLPIKSMDYIHQFFSDRTDEFIGIVPREVWYSVRRVKFYHVLTGLAGYRSSKLLKALDRGLEYAQRLVRINRLKHIPDWSIYDGWQWFSVTDDFARHVVAHSDQIERVFRWTIAPDELVLQTLAMNSSFRTSLHDTTSLTYGSMRYIDWKRGKPYVFGPGDLEELLNSPFLFARKFDEDSDYRRLVDHLRG